MEKDIKILEKLIKSMQYDANRAAIKRSMLDGGVTAKIIKSEEQKSLENLIKGYRELEEKCQRYKESKDEYKNKYLEVTNFYLESVPYSTIKEKIEELQGILDVYVHEEDAEEYQFEEYYKIQVLQELMEDK